MWGAIGGIADSIFDSNIFGQVGAGVDAWRANSMLNEQMGMANDFAEQSFALNREAFEFNKEMATLYAGMDSWAFDANQDLLDADNERIDAVFDLDFNNALETNDYAREALDVARAYAALSDEATTYGRDAAGRLYGLADGASTIYSDAMGIARSEFDFYNQTRANLARRTEQYETGMNNVLAALGAPTAYSEEDLAQDYNNQYAANVDALERTIAVVDSRGEAELLDRGLGRSTVNEMRERDLVNEYAPAMMEARNAAYTGAVTNARARQDLIAGDRARVMGEYDTLYSRPFEMEMSVAGITPTSGINALNTATSGVSAAAQTTRGALDPYFTGVGVRGDAAGTMMDGTNTLAGTRFGPVQNFSYAQGGGAAPALGGFAGSSGGAYAGVSAAQGRYDDAMSMLGYYTGQRRYGGSNPLDVFFGSAGSK